MIDSPTFIVRLERALAHKEAFVLYRKPGSNTFKSYYPSEIKISKRDKLLGSGFVFSPFDSSGQTVLFSSDSCEIKETKWSQEEDHFGNKGNPVQASTRTEDRSSTNKAAKENYIKLIGETIDFLKEKEIAKVVLSRREELECKSIRPLEIFFRMATNYPHAFVYLWYHPDIGMWAGASPETLLQGSGQKFKTMALAGTQLFKGDMKVAWGEKEKREQALVTAQIERELAGYLTNVGRAYTTKAGNLLHLQTDIEGNNDKDTNLAKIIRKLHPTAAVCGFPRRSAYDFILEKEGYSRGYYAGFLGELRAPKQTDFHLFVNLRCMRLFPDEHKVWIYVGGGITDSSSPEAEWEETVAKSKTMKSVLKSQ